MTKEEYETRLKEVIKMAHDLKWIFPPTVLKDETGKEFHTEYPVMILSEVEKCMIAMVDDDYLRFLQETNTTI